VPDTPAVGPLGTAGVETDSCELKLTVAEAVFEVSAWLRAVTTTVYGADMEPGAAYSPAAPTVPGCAPAGASAPSARDQVTAVSLEPLTVAVNCWV